MAEKLRLNINGKEVTGYAGQTILEVAKENGIDIPTLCYDKRVEIYGACGLCVVEAEGNPNSFVHVLQQFPTVWLLIQNQKE